MLLQCHVSRPAREIILKRLAHQAQQRACEILEGQYVCPTAYFPLTDHLYRSTMFMSDDFSRHVYSMINKLDDDLQDVAAQSSLETDNHQVILALSARDIVSAIDSLFHPYSMIPETADPIMLYSQSTFHAHYSHLATHLDKLRREILLLANLASPVPTIHPWQESWLLLQVGSNGAVVQFEDLQNASIGTKDDVFEGCDTVQMAAARLAGESTLEVGSYYSRSYSHAPTNLTELFDDRYTRCLQYEERLDAYFWHSASQSLSENYPISMLSGNDTRVFEQLVTRFQNAIPEAQQTVSYLAKRVTRLQDQFELSTKSLRDWRKQINRLRVKMWYIGDVIHSKPYEETRNVAHGLTNMTVSDRSEWSSDSDSPRGRVLGSPTTFLFEQNRNEVTTMLRAPNEHGGPQKLADVHVEITKKWLQRSNIENFCRGEERIHRFCVEIKSASKRLVAETLTESPDLWSSELFTQERTQFSTSVISPPQPQPSTRPASVTSDTPSATMPWSRSAQKTDSGRARLSDAFSLPGRTGSFNSVGSVKLPRDYTGTDRSSSGSSPARTVSLATTDSISSLFSPIAGYSQSATSFSNRSRPGSTYNDIESAKVADQKDKDKTKFIEMLQQDLICMLLSDLGSPVWSCGSETDGWLQKACADDGVRSRLDRRKKLERMVSSRTTSARAPKLRKRSTSVAPRSANARANALAAVKSSSQTSLHSLDHDPFPYTETFQGLLDHLSQEVDPIGKLTALNEFRKLAILHLQSIPTEAAFLAQPTNTTSRSLPSSRRSSFDPRTASSTTSSSKASTVKDTTGNPSHVHDEPPERVIVPRMKELLSDLSPQTLFRDLQYIEAFVPSEMLDRTESGRAFFQFGLAALQYKKEICESMVDVAEGLVGKDMIKRRNLDSHDAPAPLRQAAEYWILAARENDRAAQRELAKLYLSFPDSVPTVTLPLSLSSEVFKDEIRWKEVDHENISHNKLCLALHWMQQAATNGDEFAIKQMGSQRRTISVR